VASMVMTASLSFSAVPHAKEMSSTYSRKNQDIACAVQQDVSSP